ncbi:MAG: flagellar hook-basal body complex protein FliE [Alphaproteobacteria bacterium]|nr:flagellar hook-basal body complex protein FliE [Alphaproteobacteria bacterium]
MTVNIGSAAAAYARQAQAATGGAMEPRSKDPAQSFSDLLGEAVHNAIETGKNSETMSAKGIAGTADLREVVTAVTNAEVTLQTALAIRDRVIQAYKDVISMPI